MLKNTVRRATVADIPRINDLLRQVLEVHHSGRPDLFRGGAKKYTDEQLEIIVNDDTRPIFVAEDTNGRVVGYAFCIFVCHENDNILTDVKTLYIDDLCVDETCRGQHVGRTLYDHTVAFARESGCYNLTLNVWSCNPSALRFYEKLGLVPQKIGMEKIL
ncbi:MAG: GNAT family N-acetyltransferase [Clostridia bacterium]|nr:GNAT family N-acetyltransferase [Clostridia bacterium]